VRQAKRILPKTPLPARALELLDAAGAHVKLRQVSMLGEIHEIMERLKFIEQRRDSAVASHEFEKARFYSDEERKERDNLRAEAEKFHVDFKATKVVAREDVEEVITRWSEYPFRP
jgi:ATP-dependent Clp protease ATP-binding subunit ClpC